MGLPGEITAQGSAVRSTDAQEARLTVILSGKRILGTVGRATCTNRLGAVPETA
jgi:hypothetical protein